jgi:hypothetical protein
MPHAPACSWTYRRLDVDRLHHTGRDPLTLLLSLELLFRLNLQLAASARTALSLNPS